MRICGSPNSRAVWLALIAATAAAGSAAAGPAEDYAEALEADDRGDLVTAAALMRTLAEGGYAPAQAALGTLYANGRGVPLDRVEAMAWLSVAIPRLSGRNAENATAYRDVLANGLSVVELDQARQRAAALAAR